MSLITDANVNGIAETTDELETSPNGGVKGFSFSAISTFKSCPKAFEFKYIKKLPEAFKSIEAYMGSCVHEVLEWAYKLRQEGQDASLNEALEQYSKIWYNGDLDHLKIVKEDKARADYYAQGREYILNFFNRVFPNDSSTTLFLEQRFEIRMNAAGEEVVYRGVIDRIAKGTDGTIRVTDYKTGKVDHPLDTLQLPSYALFIFMHNIDQEIELCYEDLREQRTVVVTFNRKEIRKVRESLERDMAMIRATPPEGLVTNPSILCLWCGYNPICDNPHESVNPKKKVLATVQTTSSPIPNEDFQGACPLCGGELAEKKGKFGPFLGCKNYPECRYTRDLGRNGGDPSKDPDVEGKDICPECGGLLKQRKGKFGAFMGCSNYPECRFSRQIAT